MSFKPPGVSPSRWHGPWGRVTMVRGLPGAIIISSRGPGCRRQPDPRLLGSKPITSRLSIFNMANRVTPGRNCAGSATGYGMARRGRNGFDVVDHSGAPRFHGQQGPAPPRQRHTPPRVLRASYSAISPSGALSPDSHSHRSRRTGPVRGTSRPVA